ANLRERADCRPDCRDRPRCNESGLCLARSGREVQLPDGARRSQPPCDRWVPSSREGTCVRYRERKRNRIVRHRWRHRRSLLRCVAEASVYLGRRRVYRRVPEPGRRPLHTSRSHRDSGWSAHVIVRSGTEPAVSGRSASRQPEIANPGVRGTLALNIRLPRPVRIAGVLVVATFLFDASAFGQQPDRARLDAPVATARRATGTIRIDGSLEEPDWASASPIGPLTQREPLEGQVASEATEVRVLFDEQALYLGIVCH